MAKIFSEPEIWRNHAPLSVPIPYTNNFGVRVMVLKIPILEKTHQFL
jgi:hypothetical protein